MASDAKDRQVVIVGGGPYAVEALRLAVENGAKKVTFLCREPRWVFPRRWFQQRSLTKLYWKLFGGIVTPELAQLSRYCKQNQKQKQILNAQSRKKKQKKNRKKTRTKNSKSDRTKKERKEEKTPKKREKQTQRSRKQIQNFSTQKSNEI